MHSSIEQPKFTNAKLSHIKYYCSKGYKLCGFKKKS